MESYTGNIMTLSNSIIGVSILAMPFCFKQCGIILATLMLIISSIVTRFTSHFLVKSAIIARRRTFELLAFHAFGTTGKFVVELGIIGFLMGTCIAFFVIIGDLGPAIIAKMMGTKPTDNLRIIILVGVAIFCVLPLGLLKNVDSLHSVCTATIGFYFCLVLKTMSESASRFVLDNWMDKVELWRPAGILQCLPIFSMALSCQTQLFEIYEIVANPTLDSMNYIVRVAVNICVAVYVSVGFFGYIAFSSQPFTGNILMSFKPSVMTDVMKIGFVLSVAFSFPLVIFPCRASLNSLLFKRGYTPYEGTSNYIPETKFKFLTFIIITTSLVIGILIPNIEVVLGLVGSTIGIMICLIFPVTCFICISTKNTNERLLAQILLFVGVIVMVLGTYANLYAMEEINTNVATEKNPTFVKSAISIESGVQMVEPEMFLKLKLDEEPKQIKLDVMKNPIIKEPIVAEQKPEDVRLEPPQPIEPDENIIKTDPPPYKANEVDQQTEAIVEKPNKSKKENSENKIDKSFEKIPETTNLKLAQSIAEAKKAEEVDIDAIKKEDKELQEEEKSKQREEEKVKAEFLETLEKHKEKQQEMIEEQKELLQELKKENKELKEKQEIELKVQNEARRKAANQILEVAKKAIEKLVPENANEVLKINNVDIEHKISDKLSEVIINDPIARQLLKINKTSNITNTNSINKNIPNDRMLPLPMVKNKTLNEILYQKTNDQNIKETTLKSIDEKVNNIVLNSNIKELNNDNIKQEDLKPKILIDNVAIAPVESNKVEEKQENVLKLADNDSLNPAKRDILSNINENTENINRLKREIEKAETLTENNEKCDLQDKNTYKTQSPFLKTMTEISKSDIFKQESKNIIEALKIHLKSKTVHLKRK